MSYTNERFVIPTMDILSIQPFTESGTLFLHVRYYDRINANEPMLETHLCTSVTFNDSGAAVCIFTVWDNDENNI